MRNVRLPVGVILLGGLMILILGSVSRNLGQELQPTAIRSADDIAAWQATVFILEGQTLTKLNDKLEVVKSVPLPLNPTPPPPSPIPDSRTQPSLQEPKLSSTAAPLVDPSAAGRLCADDQKVYVLYQGKIFSFDHDLNYLITKAYGL